MRYVIFDVETTGLTLQNNRIIEIGAVELNGESLGKEFQCLIDIKKTVPRAAQKIHGITTRMLIGQPEAEEVLIAFLQFIKGTILVAHNADFDMGFLRSECSRKCKQQMPVHVETEPKTLLRVARLQAGDRIEACSRNIPRQKDATAPSTIPD